MDEIVPDIRNDQIEEATLMNVTNANESAVPTICHRSSITNTCERSHRQLTEKLIQLRTVSRLRTATRPMAGRRLGKRKPPCGLTIRQDHRKQADRDQVTGGRYRGASIMSSAYGVTVEVEWSVGPLYDRRAFQLLTISTRCDDDRRPSWLSCLGRSKVDAHHQQRTSH